MFGYRVPAPDQAMLISGGRAAGNAPFRVVTGHGAYIMPFFRKVRFLTLAMCEAEVAEKCVTQQGITLNVRAVIAFKVGIVKLFGNGCGAVDVSGLGGER